MSQLQVQVWEAISTLLDLRLIQQSAAVADGKHQDAFAVNAVDDPVLAVRQLAELIAL